MHSAEKAHDKKTPNTTLHDKNAQQHANVHFYRASYASTVL